MKKLMIAAVAAATVGGAFAAPIVYDYKASVKHTYLKAGNVTVDKNKVKLYLKTQKTSSLKGYLIQDADGETAKATADVQKYNRCFLVVKNGSAEAKYRFVRIVPGILEAKWYTNKLITGDKATMNAQGYLYLGGDITDALAGSKFTADSATDTTINNEVGVSATQIRAFVSPLVDDKAPTLGIDDYFYTSCYLFGQYNEPDWNYDGTNKASLMQFRYFFADAWLNGAGFGKAAYGDNITVCCGRKAGSAGYELTSLSGNLKAGLFLCGFSGSNLAHDYIYLFEDQLWVNQWNDDLRDVDVADTWADGDLDLGTTDVGFGTWSIKINKKLNGVAITDKDVADGVALADCGAKVYPLIKAAAQTLDKNVTLFGSPLDGAMINVEFHDSYLKK